MDGGVVGRARPTWVLLGLSATLVLVLAALWLGVRPGGAAAGLVAWDTDLVARAGRWRDVVPPWAAAVVTAPGGTGAASVISVAVAVVLRRLQGTWRPGLLLLVAVAGASAVGQLVKAVLVRPRPDGGLLVGEPAVSWAYPSGHAVTSAVVLGGSAVLLGRSLRRPARAGALLLAAAGTAAVGASRVVIGYHWPTDVLGGWALGAAVVLVVAAVPVAPTTARRGKDPLRPPRPSPRGSPSNARRPRAGST